MSLPSRRASAAARRAARSAARRARPSAAASLIAPVAQPDTENPQQQLDWEARHRLRAAFAAGVSAIAILIGQVLEQTLNAGAPSLPVLGALQKLAAPGTVLDQRSAQVPYAEYLKDHAVELIASRAMTALGYFALAYARTRLAAAVRARRRQLAQWAFYLPVLPPVLVGAAWRPGGLGRLSAADQVVNGNGTIGSVQDLGQAGVSELASVLLTPAALALTVAIVLLSLNGMRTGLLTRFMGALGMVVGIFQVIQVGASLPLVQTFWLGGLAMLFAGRRPGGDPPAWRTGRAEPWPTAQQAAAARKAQQEQEQDDGPPVPEEEPERVPAGAHPATSRRKRKRRS